MHGSTRAQLERKEFKPIPINEQVEVLALVGNIALYQGEPMIHAHVVVGRSGGTTPGGHILEAHVRPTLEVTVVKSPSISSAPTTRISA